MSTYKLPKAFLEKIAEDTSNIGGKLKSKTLFPPKYNSETYYKDLTKYEYFDALVVVRHYVKIASDTYFNEMVGAKNADLFMLTPSISSPMGSGSDSEAVQIKFGKLNTFLVDSSQFGFELERRSAVKGGVTILLGRDAARDRALARRPA